MKKKRNETDHTQRKEKSGRYGKKDKGEDMEGKERQQPKKLKWQIRK